MSRARDPVHDGSLAGDAPFQAFLGGEPLKTGMDGGGTAKILTGWLRHWLEKLEDGQGSEGVKLELCSRRLLTHTT